MCVVFTVTNSSTCDTHLYLGVAASCYVCVVMCVCSSVQVTCYRGQSLVSLSLCLLRGTGVEVQRQSAATVAMA